MQLAQNILLTEVFDKEFESVKDEESSINYLRKLKNFKSVRTEIDGDKMYEDYYNDKFYFKYCICSTKILCVGNHNANRNCQPEE